MSWDELRAAFEALLASDPAERAARLEELTSRDPALGAELAELLAHDGAAEAEPAFLARGGEPPPGGPAGAAAPGLPARLGPYELVRELGRGGMGIVYLARRADGAFERLVAVKLIHRELGDGRLLERFRRERQVLAELEHPGIARLLDGGTTASGVAYLVMEYVEGLPLDLHCDTERLPLRARLELFLSVCAAVQHAHEHLVVHRDLKPHNILVTASGQAKLLDFGIAKVLEPERTAAASHPTIGVARLMTPAYASPEQVAGQPIAAASDVYSLGVVLYQLLTGRMPYRVETTSAVELERIVCETPAARPSDAVRSSHEGAEERARERRTTPRGLARALAGDLDRIVLMSLRKESRLRYASVEKLADDLRRHLHGLPVSAQADTLRYRASKFVRRHRTVLSVAALALASLVAGLVASLVQYRRAEQLGAVEREQRELAEQRLQESLRLAADLTLERTAAEERVAEVEDLNAALEAQRQLAQRRAEDVHGFATRLIFDLHGALYPLEGATRALELVVETGLDYLDRLAAEARDDPRLQRELAHAYLRMAEVQGGWSAGPGRGRLEEALRSADKAVTLAEGLETLDGGDLRNLFTLVSARGARGNLLRSIGEEDQALAEYAAALEVGRVIEADPSSNVGQLYAVYFAQVMRSQTLRPRVSRPAALELYLECQLLLERIFERFQRALDGRELEVLRMTVAELEYRLDGGQAAVETLSVGLERLERMAASAPGDQFARSAVRAVRALAAPVLAAEGDVDGARRQLEASCAELEARTAADPLDHGARTELVETARALMEVIALGGDACAALAAGEARLPLARTLVERSPAHARARLQLAELLAGIGRLQRGLGLDVEADRSLGEARQLLDRLVQEHPSLVEAQRVRTRVLAELGRTRRGSPGAGGAAGEDLGRARIALDESAELLSEALASAEALERAGIPELDPDPATLRAELSACRLARAALDE